MSIQHITWAIKTTTPGAPAKLVLICLSNYCGEDGRCWPTVGRLASDSQLSETGVRDALRKLIDANLIREDAGTTSSKRVFTLLGTGGDQ